MKSSSRTKEGLDWLHQWLINFQTLSTWQNSLKERLTSLAELVPNHLVAIGLHDASGKGMGRVWLPAIIHSNLQPLLWQAKFPYSIHQDLVSWTNPTGTVTNSDLELASCMILQEVDCTRHTVLPLGNNTPSISWHLKGFASTVGDAAYLLCLNSLQQHHFQYLAKAGWIAGPMNQMANDCHNFGWYWTHNCLPISTQFILRCNPGSLLIWGQKCFCLDLSIAEEEASAAVIPKWSRVQDGHWKTWETFIANFKGIDPLPLEAHP